MEYTDVVRKRRMVRHFTFELAPTARLNRIVQTAHRAPGVGFSQGVSYIVITDPATRQRLATVVDEKYYVSVGFDPFISQAPAQILTCTSDDIYVERYREPDKKPDPVMEDTPWPVPCWYDA